MRENDWNDILDTFTELYLENQNLEGVVEKTDLEEYPQDEKLESDEDLGEYIRKITEEIDQIWDEEYNG